MNLLHNKATKINLIVNWSKSLFLIILLSLFVFRPVSAAASKVYQVQQLADSLKQTPRESMDKITDFDSAYLQKAEVEHQVLLRNIFAVSFIFLLVMLIFTMYFYGSKIKKVSKLILLQDEALKSTKDQLIKIINIFNYMDQQVYITDSKGIVEWVNACANKYFKENYDKDKISLVEMFNTENQGIIFKGINGQSQATYQDNLFNQLRQWKMIPIQNSKGEFSNMVFIC
jgi:hypothetical protein